MLPSSHGGLGFLFWLSPSTFWAMKYLFLLGQIQWSWIFSQSSKGYGVIVGFFYSVFFRQKGIEKRRGRVIGDSWRGFLLSPSTVEARSVSIRRNMTRAPLWCLLASSSSTALSHNVVGLQCLTCGQHAPRIFSLGSRACGPHSIFQVVTGGSWRHLLQWGSQGRHVVYTCCLRRQQSPLMPDL